MSGVGDFHENDIIKVICEQCNKPVEVKNRIVSYGPDVVVGYDNQLNKRIHWFCTQECAIKYNKFYGGGIDALHQEG